jgi:molybdopterin synthase sulfur carrier subunit
MLQFLTSGVKDLWIDARNIEEVVGILEKQFPGMSDRLLVEGNLVSTVVVSVDGQVSRLGLLERVQDESEVHFVPNMGGGCNGPHPLPE